MISSLVVLLDYRGPTGYIQGTSPWVWKDLVLPTLMEKGFSSDISRGRPVPNRGKHEGRGLDHGMRLIHLLFTYNLE